MPNCPDPRTEYQRAVIRILLDRMTEAEKAEFVDSFGRFVVAYNGAVEGMLADVERYANEGEK